MILNHLKKQNLKIHKKLGRKTFMRLKDVICCPRCGWRYQNIPPTFTFPLDKTSGLIWLSLIVLCFSEKFLAGNFKEILFKKIKGARCVHSVFVGRVPLTLCIIIEKIASLSKPHPPLVTFRTLQFMPLKQWFSGLILKHSGVFQVLSRRWQRILKTKLILFSKSCILAIYHLVGDSGR